MNYSRNLMLLALAGAMLLTNCKKYEDGPLISLRSKKERIANTWRVDRAMSGSQNVTANFDQYELQMLRNGSATLAALYSLGNLYFEFQTTGSWELVNNNEDLRLDFANDAADATYEILRLKEKELWLREKGGTLEFQLVPK